MSFLRAYPRLSLCMMVIDHKSPGGGLMALSPWIVWGLSSHGRRSDNRIPQFKSGSIRLEKKNRQRKWTYWLEPHQGSLKNRGQDPYFQADRRKSMAPVDSHIGPAAWAVEPNSEIPPPLVPHALVLNGRFEKKQKKKTHVAAKNENKEIPPHLNHLRVICVPLRLSRRRATATPRWTFVTMQ